MPREPWSTPSASAAMVAVRDAGVPHGGGTARRPGGVPGVVAIAVSLLALGPPALWALGLAPTHASTTAAAAGAALPILPHELIAQEGGAIGVMRVAGEIVWMGLGPRLVAVDGSLPSAPRVIGRSAVLGGSIQDLAIGSVNPNAVGGSPDVAWALLTGNRLVGLDLADPAVPAALGTVDVLTDCVGLAMVDDHVWVATDRGDLLGYDVRDPRAPEPSGRVDGVARPYAVRRVGAVGRHVVLAANGDGTPPQPILLAVDVADPLHPGEAAALANPGPDDWYVRDMYVDGRTAWVVGGYPFALIGVDLSTPSEPTVTARLESDEVSFSGWVTVGDGHAYVTGGDGGHNYYETAVIDVRAPGGPVFMGSYALGGGWPSRTSDPTGGMAVLRGHFWYGTVDGHLLVLDARDPDGELPMVADVQTIGVAGAMSVSGTLGLLGLSEALLTLDLSRPQAPRPLTTTLVHFYPSAMAMTDDTALVLTHGHMDVLGGELHSLRLDDPSRPQLVGSMFRGQDPCDIAVSGRLGALVARGDDDGWWQHGVTMLDITQPLTPTRIAQVAMAGGAQDVVLSGRVMYVASPDWWTPDPARADLVIFDVSDPARPNVLSRLSIAGVADEWNLALEAAGDYLYLVAVERDGTYGRVITSALYAIDVADPRHPAVVARMPLEDPLVGPRIVQANGYLFLPGAGGVVVIDVNDPAQPSRPGLLPTGGDAARDVAVQSGLVYVSAGHGGLYVFVPRLYVWPDPELPPTSTPTPGQSTTDPPTRPAATASPSAAGYRLFAPHASHW